MSGSGFPHCSFEPSQRDYPAPAASLLIHHTARQCSRSHDGVQPVAAQPAAQTITSLDSAARRVELTHISPGFNGDMRAPSYAVLPQHEDLQVGQDGNRIAIYWYEDRPLGVGGQMTVVRRTAWLESIRDGHCTVRVDAVLDPANADQNGTSHTLPPGTWSLTP